MKNKSILSLIIFLLGFGVSTTSCEDMLTPDMERTAGGFRGNDTVYFYLGIMANLQEMIENNVILGEVRGDLAETTSYTSDSVSQISNFERLPDGDNGLLNRAAYYKVINQCNFYLANVDTMVMKNNIYYMRKECAQVYAIRAWTYMQLVQNYGSVPFITKPVDNANTGWEKNPEAWATADNLVDLLKADLERAHAYEERYGFPNYGNLNTGSVQIAHKLMVFPSQVVLGDLYLLRGKDKSDYEKAATQYFEYLSADTRQVMGMSAGYSMDMVNGVYHYTPFAGSYTTFVVSGTSPGAELLTVLPSAANSFFGKVLTRVPQMFGFDISSSSSTGTSENDKGETETSTSGRISVQPNYKTRQIAPAFGYLNLCADQIFVKYKDFISDEDSELEYIDMGDARIAGTVANVRTQDAGIVRFIQKFATNGGSSMTSYGSGFNFRYTLPVYRLRQVYLRYAEALNRAGFPQHAFAILRNGLNEDKLPTLMLGVKYDDSDPENPKAYQYYYTETEPNGCFYIGADELRRAQDHPEFMNFAIGNGWQFNYGIKEAGSSEIIATDQEKRYVYGPVVAKRVEQEALRLGFSEEKAKALAAEVWTEEMDNPATGEDEEGEDGEEGEGEGEDDDTPEINPDDYEIVEPEAPKEANPWEITAMETLLADEMALECAYEGFRFYDLMRIARHKNNDSNTSAANEGTTWLAWIVSRRSLDLKPYAEPATVGPLYTKLLDMNNWYLQNPVY